MAKFVIVFNTRQAATGETTENIPISWVETIWAGDLWEASRVMELKVSMANELLKDCDLTATVENWTSQYT